MEDDANGTNSYDNIEEELKVIDHLRRSLDNLRIVSSSGEDSFEHLLTLPEIAEIDEPDEETVDYVKSLISNVEEQRLISEDGEECITSVENTAEEEIFTDPHDIRSIETYQISEPALPSNPDSVLQDDDDEERQVSTSSSSSKFSFFSSFFSSKKGASTSSSSASSKGSYFSRLFGRKKSEPPSPQSLFSIPSCNSQVDDNLETIDLEQAERLIEDTEKQGPAGTPHLSSLARTIQRPILAFSSSMRLSHTAGRDFEGEPIMIQFHSARPGMATGHWTLLGNRDPEGLPMTLNNCLFNVVFAQTGRKPSDLRQETIKEMRKHIKSLARRIQALVKQHECQGLIIMIGGARYNGSSPSDAQKVIDDSQHGTCHPRHLQGHPRGHASHPSATGPTDSAENYSRGGWKTGFLSRSDQDHVGHMALCTNEAQRAMDALNRGSHNEAIRLNPNQLPGSLPQGAEFRDGQQESPRPIRQLVLVLRHHTGQANNPDYPVFVHTFYPVVT
uniref:Uncharacterized protein n=1 Tax=Bracon brevicornis TaxID=1563983 RepID=A0A6V7JS27_9HYME